MKNQNNVEKFIEMFEFDLKQALVLFTLQKMIVLNDIEIEKNDEKKVIKRSWLANWEKGIIDFICESQKQNINLPDKKELKNVVAKISKDYNNLWYYLILINVMIFTPYVCLNFQEEDNEYKKCSFASKEGLKFIQILADNYFHIKEDDVLKIRKIIETNLTNIVEGIFTQSITAYQENSCKKVRDIIIGILADNNALKYVKAGFGDLDANSVLNTSLSLCVSGVIADNNIYDNQLFNVCGGGLLKINDDKNMGIIQSEIINVPEYTAINLAMFGTAINIVKKFNILDVDTVSCIINYYKDQMIIFQKDCIDLIFDISSQRDLYENTKKVMEYIIRQYNDLILLLQKNEKE